MLARLKPDPPQLSDFAIASAKHARASAAWEKTKADIESLRLAASWQKASAAERTSDRFAYIRGRIEAAFPNGALPRSHRLPLLVQEAEERVELEQPKWFEACEAYSIACSRESTRVAISLQPRQRDAARKIAKAVESLSLALQEARDLHVEFASASPTQSSPYWPDITGELRFANLADPHGAASAWARRMRKLGVLT